MERKTITIIVVGIILCTVLGFYGGHILYTPTIKEYSTFISWQNTEISQLEDVVHSFTIDLAKSESDFLSLSYDYNSLNNEYGSLNSEHTVLLNNYAEVIESYEDLLEDYDDLEEDARARSYEVGIHDVWCAVCGFPSVGPYLLLDVKWI